MLRLAFDFIIAWREIRARPNAYRGKILSRPWEINDTGTLIEQYRYPNATIPASLLIPPYLISLQTSYLTRGQG